MDSSKTVLNFSQSNCWYQWLVFSFYCYNDVIFQEKRSLKCSVNLPHSLYPGTPRSHCWPSHVMIRVTEIVIEMLELWNCLVSLVITSLGCMLVYWDSLQWKYKILWQIKMMVRGIISSWLVLVFMHRSQMPCLGGQDICKDHTTIKHLLRHSNSHLSKWVMHIKRRFARKEFVDWGT